MSQCVFGSELSAPVRQAPSAPPALVRQAPKEAYRCQRYYVYQEKVLPCDSNLGGDAEMIRPIIKDVPSAVTELDTYQKNRRQIQNLTYVGSVGMLLLIGSFVYGAHFMDDAGPKGPLIQKSLMFSGIGIAGGSLFYGLTYLSNNEKHLGYAIQNYNEARPEKRIELKFSTNIN